MKCLENLSLVNDKCLDDLQKDIELLIASYIDLHKMCYDILDKMLEKDPGVYRIKRVINMFNKHTENLWGESCFCTEPKWVDSREELAKCMVFWTDEKPEEYIEQGILYGIDYANKIENITDGYWVYREGTNWELEIETTEELFEYLKCCINVCSKEEIIEIARDLKQFAKENGYYK